jgi:hypothetical protein
MNFTRILLAAVGAFAAYFIFGGLTFVLLPSMKTEFAKYPAIYRDHDSIMKVMPIGMASMFIGIIALAILHAMSYRSGSGLVEGARFGLLIAIFALCAFVIHNYVNLNIGWKLTAVQAVAYSIQWLIVGIVMGLIYKPA